MPVLRLAEGGPLHGTRELEGGLTEARAPASVPVWHARADSESVRLTFRREPAGTVCPATVTVVRCRRSVTSGSDGAPGPGPLRGARAGRRPAGPRASAATEATVRSRPLDSEPGLSRPARRPTPPESAPPGATGRRTRRARALDIPSPSPPGRVGARRLARTPD
jgi:hypothetical protein